jgi:oxygen-independent coproporphyrinogen-3 oxidase
LRLTQGIDLTEYEKRFGIDLTEKYAGDLMRLKDLGLIEYAENRLRLTNKGFLFSNEVFAAFV